MPERGADNPVCHTATMIHRTRPAMGTLFEVLLGGDDEENLTAIADAILDEIQRIDQLLSRFNPRSELSRINRIAATEPALVDREVAALLQTCFEAQLWTQGAFDITARGGPPLRGRAAGPIAFDRESRAIRFTAPGVQLDMGGIGKGYALDRAVELLAGVPNALIHGGTSSVIARGQGSGGRPWSVALRHAASGQVVRCVELCNAALSCSATTDQGDIIDPRTGQPRAENLSCAIIAPSAIEAEILSTALVCLGREAGERLVERHGLGKVQCIWIE